MHIFIMVALIVLCILSFVLNIIYSIRLKWQYKYEDNEKEIREIVIKWWEYDIEKLNKHPSTKYIQSDMKELIEILKD